jgi:hypothetical protein
VLSQPVVGNDRCVADASGEGESCPPGHETVTLRNTDGSPVVDDGIVGKACIPSAVTCP